MVLGGLFPYKLSSRVLLKVTATEGYLKQPAHWITPGGQLRAREPKGIGIHTRTVSGSHSSEGNRICWKKSTVYKQCGCNDLFCYVMKE